MKKMHEGLQKIIKTMTKIYLAIPYTWNPNKSFEIANKVAAKLIIDGNIVFSPISHSHVIADHMQQDLRWSYDLWMKQDLAMIDWADEVHVVCIGEYGSNLIADSKGVRMEIDHANQNNKPVKIIDYYD